MTTTFNAQPTAPYIYHTHSQLKKSVKNDVLFDSGKNWYINTTTMPIQFIMRFLLDGCPEEIQEKINDVGGDDSTRDLVIHVIKFSDPSFPTNRYCELLLVDVGNELVPILKENINRSSYYSLCRMNHTYCLEEDIAFTTNELLQMCRSTNYDTYIRTILRI
jgi:hypothetical protein